MYETSRSAVLFSVAQGVAQGCSLFPILFSDDFVGVSDSKEKLKKLIDVVYSYCSKWRIKANVTKSAVLVFSKDVVEWGEHHLPTVTEYTYLGVDFASNGAWNGHIKKVLDSGRKKDQLYSVISNRDINMSARRLLLLSVVRPSLEYGNEVWEGNKSQSATLASVFLGGGKHILGCSSKICNEAVKGNLGIDSLQCRRDKAKLKWWYKLVTMPEDRYPKILFGQDWNKKLRRGRQRKVWSRLVDNIFVSLKLDKAYWLKNILDGSRSLKQFQALTGKSIRKRESKRFEEGLNAKVKLSLYKTIGKGIEFKKYLHRVIDAGPDCYLSLGQELMGLLKNWVDIGAGKVMKSVSCVVLSVRVLVICCGSVRRKVVEELTFC